MDGLQQKLGQQVDFINLDVDISDTKELRANLGMRGRAHYILIDAEQNKLGEWRGPLNEGALATQIEELLGSLEGS